VRLWSYVSESALGTSRAGSSTVYLLKTWAIQQQQTISSVINNRIYFLSMALKVLLSGYTKLRVRKIAGYLSPWFSPDGANRQQFPQLRCLRRKKRNFK
jgi:hypothetical protein